MWVCEAICCQGCKTHGAFRCQEPTTERKPCIAEVTRVNNDIPMTPILGCRGINATLREGIIVSAVSQGNVKAPYISLDGADEAILCAHWTS